MIHERQIIIQQTPHFHAGRRAQGYACGQAGIHAREVPERTGACTADMYTAPRGSFIWSTTGELRRDEPTTDGRRDVYDQRVLQRLSESPACTRPLGAGPWVWAEEA